MTEAIADLFLTGLKQANELTTRHWQELLQSGASLGFMRLLDPMVRLVQMLEYKSNSLHWDGQLAARVAIEMALLAKLSQEELTPTLPEFDIRRQTQS